MIKHVKGRVIVKADIEGKNWHTFADGTKIRVERQYDNLDRKHTEQVLGEVISAENIPAGAMVLFHHNCIHPVNQIYNHSKLSGDEIASGVRIFSFLENECFLWKMPGEENWKPNIGFAICEYVFEPYKGELLGIAPKKIKNVLYIASEGNYNGKICRCLNATGLPIIFLNEKGVEETIIRLRTFNEENDREEVIAIDNILTSRLNKGELYIGTNERDCKPLNNKNDKQVNRRKKVNDDGNGLASPIKKTKKSRES